MMKIRLAKKLGKPREDAGTPFEGNKFRRMCAVDRMLKYYFHTSRKKKRKLKMFLGE